MLRLYHVRVKGDYAPEIAPCAGDSIWFTSRFDSWIGLLNAEGEVVHFNLPPNFHDLGGLHTISCRELLFVANFSVANANERHLFSLSI